jgi:hypothetical protein
LTINPASGRPERTGRGHEQLGRVIAEELEGVAALDQANALGDQALDLDRLDLGAVLLRACRGR